MSSNAPLPRHSLYLRLLRLSLLAGAVYDLVFGAVIALVPELASRLLSVAPPAEDFYRWLIALFLVILAAVYVLAAYDPTAYAGNIAIAIAGRAAAGLLMVLAARGRSELAGLYAPAAADFFFAAVHALCWWPIRRGDRH